MTRRPLTVAAAQYGLNRALYHEAVAREAHEHAVERVERARQALAAVKALQASITAELTSPYRRPVVLP